VRYEFKLIDSKQRTSAVPQTTVPAATAPIPGVAEPFGLPPLRLDQDFHPIGLTKIEMQPALKGKVYAGVCISGSVVEVSEIKLWVQNTEYINGVRGHGLVYNYETGEGYQPVFATPSTEPAYVPANYIDNTVTGFINPVRPVPSDSENKYVWKSSGAGEWSVLSSAQIGYKITFTPKVSPNFADVKIGYEFLTVQSHPSLTFEGVERKEYDDDAVMALPPVYTTGRITIDPAKMESGVPVTGKYKIVARDASLDLPEIKSLPEYSLLQTLPEYNFTVEITKP